METRKWNDYAMKNNLGAMNTWGITLEPSKVTTGIRIKKIVPWRISYVDLYIKKTCKT